MQDKVKPFTRWKHIKQGGSYVVATMAENPNTEEEIVVYMSRETFEHTWWRPLDEFLEKFELVE